MDEGGGGDEAVHFWHRVRKDLLVREEDVQVLHGFGTTDEAQAYLSSELFTADVVGGLSPLLKADPEIRIYQVA